MAIRMVVCWRAGREPHHERAYLPSCALSQIEGVELVAFFAARPSTRCRCAAARFGGKAYTDYTSNVSTRPALDALLKRICAAAPCARGR